MSESILPSNPAYGHSDFSLHTKGPAVDWYHDRSPLPDGAVFCSIPEHKGCILRPYNKKTEDQESLAQSSPYRHVDLTNSSGVSGDRIRVPGPHSESSAFSGDTGPVPLPIQRAKRSESDPVRSYTWPTANFREERLIDDTGNQIVIQFHGDQVEAYRYLAIYLEFRLRRLTESYLSEGP